MATDLIFLSFLRHIFSHFPHSQLLNIRLDVHICPYGYEIFFTPFGGLGPSSYAFVIITELDVICCHWRCIFWTVA